METNYKEIFDKSLQIINARNGIFSVLHTTLDLYYNYNGEFEFIYYDNIGINGEPYELIEETIICIFEKKRVVGYTYMHCKKCLKMIYEFNKKQHGNIELSEITKKEMICLCPVAKYRYC